MVASGPAQASAVARPADDALVWKTTSAGGLRRGIEFRRRCETCAERRGKLGTGGIEIDECHFGTGQPDGEGGDQKADEARSDHHDAVARSGPGIPQTIEGGFHIGGERGAARRQMLRQESEPPDRRDEKILMRMEGENRPAEKRLGARLDTADGAVAVFDRERESSALKRCAHRIEFGGRHPSLENQPLGAAADPRPQRPDQSLLGFRFGQFGDLELGASRLDIPQGAGLAVASLAVSPVLRIDCHFLPLGLNSA